MTWLLDTSIFIWAEHVRTLPGLCAWANEHGGEVTGAVLDEVRRNLKTPTARAAKAALDTLRVREIPLGGPIAATVAALRSRRGNPSNDLGEHESVACVLHDEAVTFVTNDRGAAWCCLDNVGPRVVSTRWWIRERLPDALAVPLLDEVRRRYPNQLPVWMG